MIQIVPAVSATIKIYLIVCPAFDGLLPLWRVRNRFWGCLRLTQLDSLYFHLTGFENIVFFNFGSYLESGQTTGNICEILQQKHHQRKFIAFFDNHFHLPLLLIIDPPRFKVSIPCFWIGEVTSSLTTGDDALVEISATWHGVPGSFFTFTPAHSMGFVLEHPEVDNCKQNAQFIFKFSLQNH